ncbi:hypothetical protein HDU82_008451 [Entophlyctis luteolus]|nr:hypothetical protein HDU82_008451 [Entophlyctis luteolus]
MFGAIYETLKVSPTASQKEIKKAYFSRVFELHPDRQHQHDQQKSQKTQLGRKSHTTTKDSTEFVKVVKAYEILSDPERRRRYDVDSSRRRSRRGTNSATDDGFHQREYGFHPRRRRGSDASYGSGTTDEPWANPGYARDDTEPNRFHEWAGAYTGPMNTKPLYMENWKMGLLVFGVGCLGSFTIHYIARERIRARLEAADAKERELFEYLDRKAKKAVDEHAQNNIQSQE